MPDHPQVQSFNPTRMKDLKAANPGAEINLVEPPQPNNKGDARLSYPIQVPPGREGVQPQLGHLLRRRARQRVAGVGWDIPIPSISVDTRWGVPRYDNGEIDA